MCIAYAIVKVSISLNSSETQRIENDMKIVFHLRLLEITIFSQQIEK